MTKQAKVTVIVILSLGVLYVRQMGKGSPDMYLTDGFTAQASRLSYESGISLAWRTWTTFSVPPPFTHRDIVMYS